jgi:hypothetical protein
LYGFGHLNHEIHVGAGAVLAAEIHVHAQILRRPDLVVDLLERPSAVAAELALNVEIGHRHGHVDDGNAAALRLLQIVGPHAAPDHQSGTAETRGHDGATAVALFLAHGGNADFKLGNAGRVEGAGDGDLLIDGEGHAGGLFAVAKRGVIDRDEARFKHHGSLKGRHGGKEETKGKSPATNRGPRLPSLISQFE